MNINLYTDEEHNRIVQTLLDNFDEYFETGLCSLITNITYAHVINTKEMEYLNSLIPNSLIGCGYYWPRCEKEPRIKWLKSLLK